MKAIVTVRFAPTKRWVREAAERFEEECRLLEEAGWALVRDYRSGSGATRERTYVRPKSGWEGVEAWARFYGAVHADPDGGLIVMTPGGKVALVGARSRHLERILRHTGYAGEVKIVEGEWKKSEDVVARKGGMVVLRSRWLEAQGQRYCCRQQPGWLLQEDLLLPVVIDLPRLRTMEEGRHPEGQFFTTPLQYEKAWLKMIELPGYEQAREQLEQ